ncbi:uncharacterized protein LOC131207318 [Anopheles bellator]|uniref:uncharacterized protein LOC131207318 n=1 Tax=Anopheles bellator TaxID=139047 RepID=UPI0026479BBA|nr:uncharacterized protein LOC131207318 [Anopheles bellator]
MNAPKGNSKKPVAKKSIRNVLVQPYEVTWPTIPKDDFDECVRRLEQVDRKYFVYGCNPVIRALQNGTSPVFFILNSFHPKIFAKTIIRMARRRSPSVLTLSLPSFPGQPKQDSMMMAIVPNQESEPAPAIKALLEWTKQLCVREKFIKAAIDQVKKTAKVSKKAKRKHSRQPLTKEQLAALYVLQPIGEAQEEKLKRIVTKPDAPAAQDTLDFISFSGDDNNRKRKAADSPSSTVSSNRKQPKETYVPLKINRVQGNANRVEHKKIKRRHL